MLYALTLAGQLAGAAARAIITTVLLWIVGLLTGWSIPVNLVATVVAFAPLVLSLLSVTCPPLIAPIDGRWWEISSGGRAPEQDEREAFQEAFAELQEADPELRPPRHWFVAEDPDRNASAYASSLRVTRGLLESPHAAAVIAHELGHLRTSDAHLTSALNLLLLKPMDTPAVRPLWSLAFRGLAWFASGQAVLTLTANAWEAYWRSREFAADDYAAQLGQAHALAQSLTLDSLPFERPIRAMRFSRATHPYTKPRIARLHEHPTRQGDQQ
ncbi:MAG TPA: M48 family metalloprotease [Solirubrobacteraceae bacterium]|nr:M48 family metalloprotease [Solirubrobacteraceae bacterium]